MTRKDALALLKSSDFMERLAAARTLERLAKSNDLSVLVAARERETQPWARHSLDTAIRALGGEPLHQVDENGVSDLGPPIDVREYESKIIEDITETFIHELGPIVGRLEVKAKTEVNDYANSNIKYEVSKLKKLADSVRLLALAARSPVAEQFDLAELVRRIAQDHAPTGSDFASIVSFAGTEQATIVGDPSLIDLCIGNGVRNAFEALADYGEIIPPSIVVTWSVTREEWWIAIRDSGPGLPAGVSSLFQSGVSYKGNKGFGLYIARRAAWSLGASLVLENASGGGAIFRLNKKR